MWLYFTSQRWTIEDLSTKNKKASNMTRQGREVAHHSRLVWPNLSWFTEDVKSSIAVYVHNLTNQRLTPLEREEKTRENSADLDTDIGIL